MKIHEREIDAFTAAYIEAALWSSNDESDPSGGEPIDKNYGPEDLDTETLDKMIADCAAFQAAHADDLSARSAEQGGHDLWLTRNGHGCGFWETPDWPEEIGKRLTEAAKRLGERNLYVEHGTIHQYQ
jgi:hypothetical protein